MMKSFFGSLLGTLLGLVVFFFGAGMIGLLLLLGVASMEEPAPVIEDGSYLVFDLDANLTDAPAEDDLGALGDMLEGSRPRQLQVHEVVRGLRAAAADGRIAGVYLTGCLDRDGYGCGFPVLREVREALLEVRKAGKPVLAHLQFGGAREMYLMTAADELLLDPSGEIELAGFAARPFYLAGLFEKAGIEAQVVRAGRYKSAAEPFVRRNMSPEEREQLQAYIDDLWTGVRDTIAGARRITPQALQAAVDTHGAFLPHEAVAAGLADRLATVSDVLGELKGRTGVSDAGTPFTQVAIDTYLDQLGDETGPDGGSGAPAVAVLYAEGPIINGEGEWDEVGGDRFAREIRRMREDDDIKAVVLRINSPGGSASAAEFIRRELALLGGEKPVVVSMGTYAASGGYWIAADAERIFAQPETLTGSIGVFGLHFSFKGLSEKIGVDWDGVQTGRFAGSYDGTRPMDAAELARQQVAVDWIYDEFISHVAQGRDLAREDVERVAQGRIWSGARAMEAGLVDEMGSLDDAIRHAAKKAGLGENYRVGAFPGKTGLFERLMEIFSGGNMKMAFRTAGGGGVERLFRRVAREFRALCEFNDPTGMYARLWCEPE